MREMTMIGRAWHAPPLSRLHRVVATPSSDPARTPGPAQSTPICAGKALQSISVSVNTERRLRARPGGCLAPRHRLGDGYVWLHESACCTKTASPAPVGSKGCQRRLSAAEWGDRASHEARWAPGWRSFSSGSVYATGWNIRACLDRAMPTSRSWSDGERSSSAGGHFSAAGRGSVDM